MRRFGAFAITAVLAAALGLSPAHATMSIVATVPVSWGPASFAIDPVTNLVYVGSVTDDDSAQVTSQVQVLAGNQVIGSIKQKGLNPVALAVDPLGQLLYVSSFAGSKVIAYSTITNAVAHEFPFPGASPWGMSIDQRSGRLYVAGFANNTITFIERAGTSATFDLAPTGCQGAVGVAYNSKNDMVYVTCMYSGSIVALSGATGEIKATIDAGGLGAYTQGIAAEPNGDLVYFTNSRLAAGPAAGTVGIINSLTNQVIVTAYTGGQPVGVTVSTLGTPYVTLSAVNRLAVLTPASGVVAESIDLPVDEHDGMNEPLAVAVHPSGRLVYVGNFHAESISIVNSLPYS